MRVRATPTRPQNLIDHGCSQGRIKTRRRAHVGSRSAGPPREGDAGHNRIALSYSCPCLPPTLHQPQTFGGTSEGLQATSVEEACRASGGLNTPLPLFSGGGWRFVPFASCPIKLTSPPTDTGCRRTPEGIPNTYLPKVGELSGYRCLGLERLGLAASHCSAGARPKAFRFGGLIPKGLIN